MSSIQSGGLLVKDPNSLEVLTYDWDTNGLGTGVEISTSSFIVTGPDSVLTIDQDTVLSGNRTVRFRLNAGTLGGRYTVTNRIVTNETPAQTLDDSFKVLIQHR